MRMMGWFGKLLLSVLLISFLSVFTTVYMVDQYINRLLDQWNIADPEMPSLDVKDFLSKMVDPTEILDEQTSIAPNFIERKETVPEAALEATTPVFGQQAQTGDTLEKSSEQPGLVMSVEEFNDKRKKLTNQDKSAIFSIVVSKLPQEELQQMSLLLEDGITEEELSRLEDVINAYLHQDEVARLLTILNKY